MNIEHRTSNIELRMKFCPSASAFGVRCSVFDVFLISDFNPRLSWK